MNSKKPLSIIGAGGHTRAVIDLLMDNDMYADGFYDNSVESNEEIMGIKGYEIKNLPQSTDLILAIGIPPSNFQIINQGTMLLNLIWVLVFALFLQKLNSVTYKYFSIIVVFMLPAYYFILNHLFELDNSFFNPDNLGLGRSVESLFLLPIVFVVCSILFLRQSIILISITLFSILSAYNLYEVLSDEKTYITDNWQTILEDGNAVNITVLTNWINVWIIVSIVCYAIVLYTTALFNLKVAGSTAVFC